LRRAAFYAQYGSMSSASPAFNRSHLLRLLRISLALLPLLAPIAAPASGLRILAYEPVAPDFHALDARGQQKSSVPAAQSVVVLEAFGQRFTLELERNARVDLLLTPPASAYRGVLEQNPRSWIRLTRRNGRVDALIWDGAELYVIAPGPDAADALVPPLATPDSHLMFRLSDTVVESPGATCAIGSAQSQGVRGDVAYAALVEELAAASVAGDSGGATRQLELSVIADSLFREYAGSAQNATEEIATRLNNVDGIFTSQLGLRFELASLKVHDPGSDPFSATTSPSQLLRELGQLRRSDGALRNTALTHLFTGRDFDGEAVGVAYIDAVCDAQLGAAITELRGRTTFFESLITAHEIGHNLGAPHDGEEGPCLTTPQSFLMAPRINGNDAFSTCSLREIESRLALASCVEPLPAVDLAAATSTPSLRALPGSEVIAAFSLRNLGDATARGVTAAVASRHPGLEFLTVESTAGSCSVTSNLIACQLGDVAPDTAVDITVGLRATAVGQGTTTLTVESLSLDANVANDSAVANVSVEAGTDLAVSLDAPASSEIATDFAIAVDVSNRSSLTANGVALTTTVASGLSILAAVSPGGQCTFSPTAARCDYSTIDPGRRITATLTARASASGNHRVEAVARADELDLEPADNSASVRVAVAAKADTPAEASPSGGGGGGLIAPGFLGLALLVAAMRRVSRTAPRPHRASDRA
jgi:hypothetical protein